MSGRVRDVLLSMTALVVLFVGIVLIDSRVREEIAYQVHGADHRAELLDVSHRARSVVRVAYVSVKDRADSHRPLTVFLCAAGVLTLFMFRM